MNKEKTLITHSSMADYVGDGDVWDGLYIPNRILCEAAALKKKGEVLCVAPTDDFLPNAEFYGEVLFGNRSSIRVVSLGSGVKLLPHRDQIEARANENKISTYGKYGASYLIDKGLDQAMRSHDSGQPNETAEEILEFLTQGTLIYPYAATAEFLLWAQPLAKERGVVIFADPRSRDHHWWGHRGGWSPWVGESSDSGLVSQTGVSYPKGFVGQGVGEVIEAYRRTVQLTGQSSVMLKPIYSSGGFLISMCHSEKEVETYLEKNGESLLVPGLEGIMPIEVQEYIQIDKDSRGEMIFSLQYCGPRLFGRLTRQRFSPTNSSEWMGNDVPADISDRFEKECASQAQRVLCHIQPKGWGGFDIASVNSRPLILEMNGGRPPGIIPGKQFAQAFVPRSQFVCEKTPHHPNHELDIYTAWEILKSNSLALDFETGKGVFPLVWLNGIWGMLISCGETTTEAEKLIAKANEILDVNGAYQK